MAGYGRIRQDTAGYGRIPQDTANTAGFNSIQHDTAGYDRIWQDQKYLLVFTTKTTILRSFGVRWYSKLFLRAYRAVFVWVDNPLCCKPILSFEKEKDSYLLLEFSGISYFSCVLIVGFLLRLTTY